LPSRRGSIFQKDKNGRKFFILSRSEKLQYAKDEREAVSLSLLPPPLTSPASFWENSKGV